MVGCCGNENMSMSSSTGPFCLLTGLLDTYLSSTNFYKLKAKTYDNEFYCQLCIRWRSTSCPLFWPHRCLVSLADPFYYFKRHFLIPPFGGGGRFLPSFPHCTKNMGVPFLPVCTTAPFYFLLCFQGSTNHQGHVLPTLQDKAGGCMRRRGRKAHLHMCCSAHSG